MTFADLILWGLRHDPYAPLIVFIVPAAVVLLALGMEIFA
jgi:hypothetical protein